MLGAWIRFLFGAFLITTVYFAPWGIALIRKHKNTLPIFLVTFLLGWTIIGWIIAIIWSFTSNVRETRPLGEVLGLK